VFSGGEKTKKVTVVFVSCKQCRARDGCRPRAGVPGILGRQASNIKVEYQHLVTQFPDADAQLKQLFKTLCDIEDVVGYTPASVGDSEQWSSIVEAEDNQINFCKALTGKILFSALYGMYTITLKDLKALLNAGKPVGQSVTLQCAPPGGWLQRSQASQAE
jgi:hypothetical protein